jgi:hypothetical protein
MAYKEYGMNHLSRNDLLSLEEYSQQRSDFRQKVMMHKKPRQIALGENLTLYFEDRLTIQYQIQEMLRIEKVFEADGIEEELSAYNPLIPDGDNWKATMMLEYTDVEERKRALSMLIGIEDTVWVQVGDNDRVYAIADEDLERDTEEKTSSVHFMRFQLTPEMIGEACHGGVIKMGVQHQNYSFELQLDDASRDALVGDLDCSSSD